MATHTPPRPAQRGHTAPPRALAQRMTALQRANRIRTYRAELKAKLKAGEASIVDVLLLIEEEVDVELLSTAKVLPMLLAVPKVGRVKANKILLNARVSPSKTLGGLTQRQRVELVSHLRNRSPRR